MTNVAHEESWIARNFDQVVACVVRDWKPILAATLALALIGAVAGKLTNAVTSTAYLALTPLPVRISTTEDALTKMTAEPLDVTTVSLLCIGDEVLERTMEAYNERVEELTAGDDDPYGVLPIPDLYKLRNALEYEITIAKETPYETVQSPVLKLTAKGASPAQAKLLVDTWAEECVHAAQRFQLARYKPSVDGFEQQTEAQLRKLEAVDNRVRDFWTSNNPELLEEQLNLLIGLARNYRESMWTVEQEIMQEQARAASLDAALEGEGPTLKLRWVPPQRLFQMVVAGAAAGDAPEGTQEDVLLMEQENPIHTRLATEAAIARASVAANEAKRRKLDELLVQIDEERADLQERSAAVELELERISRDSEVATSAYKNAVLKLEFARMAKALEEPGLQLLSKGAEWPLPRYRRAILFAAFSAFVGALTGMFVSVLHRLVLHPVLETVQ